MRRPSALPGFVRARSNDSTRTESGLALLGGLLLFAVADTSFFRPDRADYVYVAAVLATVLSVSVLFNLHPGPVKLTVHAIGTAVIVALVGTAAQAATVLPTLAAVCTSLIVMAATRVGTGQILPLVGLVGVAFGFVLRTGGASWFLVALGTVSMITMFLASNSFVFKYRRDLERAAGMARRAAGVDALTGLSNRRGLAEQAGRVLEAAREGNVLVGVLVADVDHFKQVNDVHGHRVGDDVLRAVADVLRQAVRPEDLLVRLGGEEFCVVLSVGSADGLHAAAERIRERVVQLTEPVPVTVSVGGVFAAPPEPPTPDDEMLYDLIDRADRLMYAAKQAGRDRVHVAPSALHVRAVHPCAS